MIVIGCSLMKIDFSNASVLDYGTCHNDCYLLRYMYVFMNDINKSNI